MHFFLRPFCDIPYYFCQKGQNTLKHTLKLFVSFSSSIAYFKTTEYRNSWILDSGLWTLDAGLWMLDHELLALDPGRWTLDARVLTLETGP